MGGYLKACKHSIIRNHRERDEVATSCRWAARPIDDASWEGLTIVGLLTPIGNAMKCGPTVAVGAAESDCNGDGEAPPGLEGRVTGPSGGVRSCEDASLVGSCGQADASSTGKEVTPKESSREGIVRVRGVGVL